MRLGTLALAALLTGCATWKHPTKTEADFNRDRYQCQTETAQTYPVNIQPMGVGQQRSGQVNCSSYGNQTNCTTTPGVYIPPPTQDTNNIARTFGFDSCMRARGYFK